MMKIKKIVTLLLSLSLIIASLFAVTALSASAETSGEEAEITPDYSQISGSAPCFVFAKKDTDSAYTYLGSSSTFRKALGRARDALHDTNNGAYKGGSAWIYVVKDLDAIGDSGNYNFGDVFNGTLTVDFGGHSLKITDKNYLLGFYTNNAAAGGLTTNVKFMNGKILTRGSTGNDRSVIRFQGEKSVYSGTRYVNLEFDNIQFENDVSSTNVPIILARDGAQYYNANQSVKANVVFNNCQFNFEKSSGLQLLKDMVADNADGKDYIDIDMTVKGASKITAPDAEKFEFIDSLGSGDSVSVAQDTQLVFPYTANAPTATYKTVEGEMHLAPTLTTDRKNTTYGLTTVSTKYGYIPESAKNAKFLIFYNDLYLDSRGTYLNAMDRVKTLTYPTNGKFKGESLTLLMTSDYNHTDGAFGNLAQIDGTVNIDLNGKTLSQSNKYMFDAVGKAVDGNIATTIINVKNGTILTKNDPVIRITAPDGGANFSYTGTKNYSFSFEGITFDRISSAEKYARIISSDSYVDNNSGNKKMHVDAGFTNCVFNSTDGALFDVSVSELLSADITVTGGSMTTENMPAGSVIIKAGDDVSRLCFNKNAEGKYMTLKMNNSTKTPTATYNDGTLEFVKICEDGNGASFELAEAGLNSYIPKMSITLDASLVVNVYIPVNGTQKFTFDGVNYENMAEIADRIVTLDNGKDYYRMTADMPAKDAAREIKLESVVGIGDSAAGGSFTFSIPKYALKVAESSNATERKVVYDTLSYIRAAYAYFGVENTDVTEKIEAILGENYDENNRPVSEGSTEVPAVFDGATFSLDSTPSLRFYLKSGDLAEGYTFKIGDRVIDKTVSADGSYIELDVYAYAMAQTVSCYKADELVGEYHIAAYLEWAKTQNNDKLVTLVERFWRYCQSARDFKNNVSFVINYVDEDGNSLAASRSFYIEDGESKSILSPAIDGYYTRDLFVNVCEGAGGVKNVVYKKIPTNIDPARAEELLPGIASWGDSITAGSNESNISSAKQYGIDLVALGSTQNGGSYSMVLENLISKHVYSGIDVANCGVGGESTATIAARANTESYYLYIASDVTVADAPVVIDLQQKYPDSLNPGRIGVLRKDFKDSLNCVTIVDENGTEIPGIITCAMPEAPTGVTNNQIYNCDYQYLVYTFTRTDGKTDAVKLSANSKVIMNAAVQYDGRTCIIFMGENNGYSDVNTTNRNSANIIAQQKEILAACGIDYESGNDRFLIISSTSGTNASRAALNAALTEEWGNHYINMGNVINSRWAYEFAGFSSDAIASVESNIAEGSVTTLLLADACHPNAVGYAVIGNVIFERFFELGLFDNLFDYYDSLNG